MLACTSPTNKENAHVNLAFDVQQVCNRNEPHGDKDTFNVIALIATLISVHPKKASVRTCDSSRKCNISKSWPSTISSTNAQIKVV
mmetsp:Transcript_31379/g.58982  ORF Transcript_31379/g.58982 Transcript_31379/m.58982 type:complete len:86 (+) Transcript_31379:130-387(+)